MILFIKALIYVAFHPFDVIHLTVVRRYVDAQKHFIGELYEGDGRSAKMIGMSCDNLPLDFKPEAPCRVRWGRSFLDPLSANTILVGGAEPQDNARVHAHIAVRRFCFRRVIILNRFVEHIMESDYAR